MVDHAEQDYRDELNAALARPAGRTIWFRWVLAHVLLIGAMLLMASWLYAATFYGVGAYIALPLDLIALFVLQWIAVKGLFAQTSTRVLWLVAFAAGGVLIVVLLGYFSRALAASPYLILATTALFGAILGLAQGMVLLREFPRGLWWTAANAAGLAGTVAMFRSLAGSVSGPACVYCWDSALIPPGLGATGFYSVVTGAALVWITRREGSTSVALARKYTLAAAGPIVIVGAVLLVTSILPAFAAGQVASHKANTTLHDISMVSPTEGWAVGGDPATSRAVIFHYFSGAWQEIVVPAADNISNLLSISMSSADDGWAANSRGVLLHYANGMWRKVDPPAGKASGAPIVNIEMNSQSSGWAHVHEPFAEPTDALLHYDGSQWQYKQLPAAVTLTALNFTSSDDGWAMGYRGTAGLMLHYSDGAWLELEGRANLIPNSVQMLSPEEGWATAFDHDRQANVMLHYSAGQWSLTDTLAGDVSLQHLTMISPHDGWAWTSNTYTHYDGARWSQLASDGSFPPVEAVSVVSADEAWAVGAETAIYHYKNGAWIRYHY